MSGTKAASGEIHKSSHMGEWAKEGPSVRPCLSQGEEFPKLNVASQSLWRGGSTGLAVIF